MRLLTLAAAVLVGGMLALAQSVTDGGLTPAAIAAGTPQGVTYLSPHEAVNLFNGNLAFNVPLYRVNGRGQTGYAMVLPVGKKWNVENLPNNGLNDINSVPAVYPYDMLWPSNGQTYRHSPGRMLIREVYDQTLGTWTCPSPKLTFTRARR